MSKVSERIFRIRKENDLSQAKMSEMLGIGRSTYKNYEVAQSDPSLSLLVKIAVIFDVSIDYIVGRCDEKKSIRQFYDIENKTSFSTRIRELRIKANMTQTEVAKAVGLTQRATYVSYERAEKEPSLPRLIALADLFGVSLNYLVGFDEK